MANWGRVDFSDFKKFQKELEKLTKNKDKFYEETIKELAKHLLQKVIPITPKTPESTGTLRRGWTSKTHEEAINGNSLTIDQFINSLKVRKKANGYEIYIVNPVNYASYVEFGHRQQIGRYVPEIGKKLTKGWVNGKLFLSRSELELMQEKDQIVQQKLDKFLKECFENG